MLRAKRWFVEIDEHDQKERRLLNFGHTFGHALETAVDHTLSHGLAVAVGVLCAIRHPASAAGPDVDRLEAHCRGLLASAPGVADALAQFDPQRFERAFRADKKHGPSTFRLILPAPRGGVVEVETGNTADDWDVVETRNPKDPRLSDRKASVKYSDLVMKWLRDIGYTHCFFVAGGNSMHLLDGARRTMTCIPVVHEVAAGIAVEYFNEQASASGSQERAFALVTAGPGVTNIVTAMAGAYLESRELLVVGGQVKSTDLARPGLRQRGIQEIDGIALLRPVSVAAERIESPIGRRAFTELVRRGSNGRKGPVFLEICLDAQGAPVDPAPLEADAPAPAVENPGIDTGVADRVIEGLRQAQRPVVLLGGGVSRSAAAAALARLRELELPVMTTWNGADRVGAGDPVYVGRPNTWGQRSANVLIQQCDFLLALGTRLGLQQTGFNWQQFAPLATVVQVDLDRAELDKGHPRVDIPWMADADDALARVLQADLPGWGSWLAQCREVRDLLPVVESNKPRARHSSTHTASWRTCRPCARRGM